MAAVFTVLIFASCAEEKPHYNFMVKSINTGKRYVYTFYEEYKIGDTVSIPDGFSDNVPAVIEKIMK